MSRLTSLPGGAVTPLGARALRRAIVVVGLSLFVAASLLPFLYLLSTSFKETTNLFSYPPEWVPSEPTLTNFRGLLSDLPFLRWTLNTLLVASAVTVVKLLIDSMAAYAFAQMEFAGRRALFASMFAMVMVPQAVLIIPLFFLVRDMGLLDTYWALILPPLANPIGIFMMTAFIRALPKDIENAARIDNCGAFDVFWRVVLPLVKPGLVVVGIYTFLQQYVSFVWPLVATQSSSLMVLTTGLASIRPAADTVNWGLISAGSLAAMVPITIVFIVFQRQFVNAGISSALKQ
ncbi:MAG: carbohydrate ABC transporter permease [Solirubrobacteraceae bacterium]